MPCLELVLESDRTHIKIGMWRDRIRQCSQTTILKIGEGEGENKPDDLGFKEIYFQYFIKVANKTYIAFQLEQEATLKKGFEVKFDSKWKFQSSTELPELNENTMRPTAVVLNADNKPGQSKRLLMLGGLQNRCSQCYLFDEKKWVLSPKLPLGHNITTNIAINWYDKAVFTFIIDAQLTIKSACLDLQKCEWTEQQTENSQEMYWALHHTQETHKIDRLHLKSGVLQENGRIAIVARGKPADMKKQISGLVLFFEVSQKEDGQYALTHVDTQLYFPSIFCRQLDHAQIIKNKIVLTQDTANEEKHEAFAIDLTPGVLRRTDNENQQHFRHIFSEEGQA